jgi:hypothetical protein
VPIVVSLTPARSKEAVEQFAPEAEVSSGDETAAAVAETRTRLFSRVVMFMLSMCAVHCGQKRVGWVRAKGKWRWAVSSEP